MGLFNFPETHVALEFGLLDAHQRLAEIEGFRLQIYPLESADHSHQFWGSVFVIDPIKGSRKEILAF